MQVLEPDVGWAGFREHYSSNTWQWLTAATDARCENAPKVDIKRPFEIRIVAKFSTFYGKYGHFPHRFTHFFFVADIPSEKKRSQLNKNEGGGGVTDRLKNLKKKDVLVQKRVSLKPEGETCSTPPYRRRRAGAPENREPVLPH